MTGQRKAVFDALFRQSGHFTADQLLQDARKVDDTVSRATVYRCLPLLVAFCVRSVFVAHCTRAQASCHEFVVDVSVGQP